MQSETVSDVDRTDLVFAPARALSTSLTYLLYGRKHTAPLDPTRILTVDPDKISRIPVNKPSVPLPLLSPVKDGEWDRSTRRVADDVVYKAFVERFERGQPWEETRYHSFMMDRLKDDSFDWRQYETYEDVTNRYDSLDELYRTIATEGYEPQRKLGEDKTVRFPHSDERNLGTYLPPEFKEITIDLGRDGELFWAAGMHRLCMAQLIGVDEIPVRIRVRHKQWQKYRDSVYTAGETGLTHPDLRGTRDGA